MPDPGEHSAHPGCVICDGDVIKRKGETFRAYRSRKTCSVDCFNALRRQSAAAGGRNSAERSNAKLEVSWAQEIRAVDYKNGFAQQVIKDRPSMGRLPPRPDLYHSYSSTAAAWVADTGNKG